QNRIVEVAEEVVEAEIVFVALSGFEVLPGNDVEDVWQFLVGLDAGGFQLNFVVLGLCACAQQGCQQEYALHDCRSCCSERLICSTQLAVASSFVLPSSR